MKKLTMVVLFILAIFAGIKYIDFEVSKKYGMELFGLDASQSQLKEAEKLKETLDFRKKVALIVMLGSIILIYFLFLNIIKMVKFYLITLEPAILLLKSLERSLGRWRFPVFISPVALYQLENSMNQYQQQTNF